MESRSRFFVFLLLILIVILSACSPADVQEIEDILDPENAELSEEQREQMAGEGYADVYYHYHIQIPDLKFKIDMPFGVNFAETDQGASFDAQGIYQDLVSFTMAASGGESGRCMINCTVNLKFVASGSIEMDDKGNCEIPMNFSFVPQGDYIMDTTCPPVMHDVFDCNAFTLVLMDPGTYTFIPGDTELYMPSGAGVTREAEIKNLVLPAAAKGTCSWKK